MPPKKPHKKLRRGLLGARIADSDEDDDWVPPGVTESPTPRATRAAGGSRAAAAPSQQRAVSINLLQSSDDDDENLDVPLSVRCAVGRVPACPRTSFGHVSTSLSFSCTRAGRPGCRRQRRQRQPAAGSGPALTRWALRRARWPRPLLLEGQQGCDSLQVSATP